MKLNITSGKKTALDETMIAKAEAKRKRILERNKRILERNKE